MNTTGAGAAFEASQKRIPHAGEVFYVRLITGIVGDPCGGGGNVLPEFVPPEGVEFAISKRHPVRWAYPELDPDYVKGNVVLSSGRFGGLMVAAKDSSSGEGAPWPLANPGSALDIRVPLRSSRRLNGIGSRLPNCPAREEGYGACPRDEAGDYLQISVQVADGGYPSTLVPIVGLFAREPAAPAFKPPTPVKRRFTLKVTTAPHATASATVKVGRRVVGRSRAKANADGLAGCASGCAPACAVVAYWRSRSGRWMGPCHLPPSGACDCAVEGGGVLERAAGDRRRPLPRPL